MGILQCFFVVLLSTFLLSTLVVHAQDQSGFVSIDCGLPANSTSQDPKTGLNYTSDSPFVQTGIPKSIGQEYLATNQIKQQLQTLRSFPEGDRNCYSIEVVKETKYLIRTTFLYGNYDGLNKLPSFDLHIGPNKWETVQILNSSFQYLMELIHIPTFNYINVCLVKTGSWIPFISILEIRPLQNGSYATDSGSLALFSRVDVASLSNRTIRYPDDVCDRFWFPFHFILGATEIKTNETVIAGVNYFQPPSTVMKSATIPANASRPLTLDLITQKNDYQFYVYMHFAEIIKLKANQSRQFNISLNGKNWYGPVSPAYLYPTTVYSKTAITGEKFEFTFFKVGGSTLPPLINALEVYYLVELPQSETNQDDVDAVMKIKSTYNITRNWQGDPCSPQDYKWQGLVCNYNDIASPVIKSLDLSSSGLKGEIDPDIIYLKSLENLDLSNNNLTGLVPAFLSQLPLKTLNLAGNNLTGTIPAALLNRQTSGSLSLSVRGNPLLCPSVSCNKQNNKKKWAVPVGVSVAGLFIIVVGLAIILWRLKRRKQNAFRNKEGESGREPLELKKRQFTYSEILHITNNFQRILGKGGFGTVYHGYLDDVEVAVKMLSASSAQGYKEFQAEVKLLLTVHHKNLTSLVGYCHENTNLGLIYEYMANGNLKKHLSDADGNPNILSWQGRLQIALEAAQGLEYLHNGCKPPIVHRDVKTTNMLLNNKLQAKLADFGLSRIFPVEGGSYVSTTIVGTPGYLDPEYSVTSQLTEKSDVFSFGVVLLEIITSQPVLSKTREKTHLSQWVSSVVENGDIKSVIDPRLGEQFDINSLWKVVELAMACVSATSNKRPNMKQVVMELNECLASEMARTGDEDSSQSMSSVELMTVSVHTELTPLAR